MQSLLACKVSPAMMSSSCESDCQVIAVGSHRISAVRLQDYKAAQRIAAEKEAQFLPKVPPAPTPSALPASTSGASAAAAGSEADIENQALLQEQRVIEARATDNTIAFQEALIEERDHGIQGALGSLVLSTRLIAASATGIGCWRLVAAGCLMHMSTGLLARTM
eukprot:GHUV01041706.1.p1 GENE.GHUV01041706.1~~GHUV01041706.1.p1  ORF type:complete len:165 (-),score=39.32 GHUV01041706.1:297-791(-)